MKLLQRVFALAALIVCCSLFVSCESLKADKGPEPEREKLSSMPHNMPASWEGQAGLPGGLGGEGF